MTKEKPRIFRRRFIPNELVELKEDKILFADKDKIITKWEYIHPRNDFRYGFSCAYFSEGFKINKIYTEEKAFRYIYCDIVDISVDEPANRITFTDLLADVVVYPDGFVKVLDLEELPDAIEKDLITIDILKDSLRKTNSLLNIIYSGHFSELIRPLDEMIIKNPI